MGKFNTKKITPQRVEAVNYAGGQAYEKTAEVELVSILLTSFVQDQFYKKSTDTLKRIPELLTKVDPKFAAKAAIYARTTFGMRSITHVLAVEVAKYLSGKEWSKKFFEDIINRPDDMSEIISYYFIKNKNKALPNSLKKGFSKAFDKFDGYQLAKYKGEGNEVSLVDIVNLVHPKATNKNKKALAELINGTLKNTDTWEAKLSEAGQSNSGNDKNEKKAQVWKELIETKKIGYLALVRNLRNIMIQSPESIDAACNLLRDKNLISKSLILPFQFVTAIEELQKVGGSNSRQVISALEDAIEISCSNVPALPGKTCVIYDRSGSMRGQPTKIGGLFAAVLAKSNNADVIVFGDTANYVNFNLKDSIFTISEKFNGIDLGGTKYSKFFELMDKEKNKYDRLIILSDGEAWGQMNSSQYCFNDYKKKTGANPFLYNFDLAGNPTIQFVGNKVIFLVGFSEKIFDLMKLAEQDINILTNTIKNSVEL